MIVIDTSALVASVFGELEREVFVDIIQKAPPALISSPTLLETPMIVHGRLQLP